MRLNGLQLRRAGLSRTLTTGHLSLTRTFSSNVVQAAPGPDATQHTANSSFDQPQDVLLTVQTHTGIGNMAHGLHILRAIEKEYGPISSYLFPREPGSGDYLPSFFFKFRDTQSLYKLSKPFTHLDIPAFLPQSEPNHTIGLKEIHRLISPTAHSSISGKASCVSPSRAIPSKRDSHFASKSPKSETRLPPLANAAQKKAHIQNSLGAWQPAAPLFGPSAKTRRAVAGASSAPNLNTSTRADNASSDRETRENHFQLDAPAPSHPVGPANSPPLRMRPRPNKDMAQTGLPPSTADTIRPARAAQEPEPEPARGSDEDTPARSVQHSSSKRERILEQTRQAAAAEAKLAADRKAAAEAAAAAHQTSETDAQNNQNAPLSIWSRFMGR
ncbi:hypothetical protein RhiJN_14397 [Ceratobasidium sp. AG-Ba]|nr:hypothetical protein RhiJN_14397 [Ceratobasidium sp. AG-Ba]